MSDEEKIPKNLQQFAERCAAIATEIYCLLNGDDCEDDPMGLYEAIFVRCMSDVLDPDIRERIANGV